MSKIKNYSRQLTVLFLAMVTVLTCIFAFTPEADAGATTYRWRLTFDVGQGNNEIDNMYVRLYYKTNNGTGGETDSYITVCTDTGVIEKGDKGKYYWISDGGVSTPDAVGAWSDGIIPEYAFPYQVVAYAHCNSSSSNHQAAYWTVRLEVFDQNLNTVSDTGVSAQATIEESKNEDSATATATIGTGSYPYVANWSVSGVPTSVNINRDGSNVSYAASISAEDNYGVNWVNAPTTTGSNCTVNNGSTASPTIVFGNKTTDYSASFTSKWTTANSSNSTVSKTFTVSSVKVPHKLTIDANGGTYNSTNPVTGNYTSEYIILATPVRTGYTFASWTKTAGNGVVNGNNFYIRQRRWCSFSKLDTRSVYNFSRIWRKCLFRCFI